MEVREGLAGYVERGEVPGLVALVSRNGEVQVDAIGTKTFGGTDSMRRDTIFRIASMTKPIAAAAAMILVEEGMLELDGPVDCLLPELANRKVLKRLDGLLEDTVQADRPISVRDLLTFRMGFGLVMGPPDRYPIMKVAVELGVATGIPAPAFPSGAPGLVSTVDDSLAFCRMLMDGGGGVLSRESVGAMRSDQLTVEQKRASGELFPGFS